jgi:hypothetical protein
VSSSTIFSSTTTTGSKAKGPHVSDAIFYLLVLGVFAALAMTYWLTVLANRRKRTADTKE